MAFVGSGISIGEALSAAGTIGSIGSDIAGMFGGDTTDAANQLYNQAKFNPYNVYSPLGTAVFDSKNGGATGSLSPEFQAALDQAQTGRTNLGNLANNFSVPGYANQYYGNLKALAAPEQTWNANDFMDKVYQKGNWGSTVGAHDLWSYANLQNQQDTGMRQQALQSAGAEQSRLFDTYLRQLQGEMGIAGIPNNLIQQGGNLGQMASGANYQASQYPWQAAQNSADASASFWGNLGGSFNSLAKKYGAPGTPSPSSTGNFLNLGWGDPFQGNGPMSGYRN